MSENNTESNIPNDNTETPAPQIDPVIDLFNRLQFAPEVFQEINEAHSNPEKWEKLFTSPDIFVLNASRSVFGLYDPNGKVPEGELDHRAMYNLIGWLLLKVSTDPVWLSYIGWFIRFCAAHTNPSSYYPIKWHPRFSPDHFFIRGQTYNITEEKQQLTDPAEVFKWKE